MFSFYKKNISTPEKIGVKMAFIAAIFGGLFPVVINRGVQYIEPITFAALSALLAAVTAFVFLVIQKKISELKKREVYFSLLMVSIFIIIIPYSLFFLGASMTSGVNTSLLQLFEIIFLLIFTPFFGEKTSAYKLIGAGGVFFGAVFILYNGSSFLNIGDLLIIASTVPYTFGNFYAKKALNIVSPATILFARYIIGGTFLLILSFFIESQANLGFIISNYYIYILISGIISLGIGKIFWYQALKRLDISKGISIVMTSPLFGLLILIIFFGERLSVYQMLGVGVMMIGLYFSIQRKSVDQKNTRYAA